MGNDGGSIPKRDELVRQKKKKEKKDRQAELAYRWRHCAITQQPLQKPIVACQMGRLYSKVAVIEALLDKTLLPESASHIKSLKDVKEVNLTDNPSFTTKAKTSETYDETLAAPYICPISGLEMSGHFRFVLFWSCGCAVSERAYKELKGSQCHKCQKEFTENDVIVLNGNEEDVSNAKLKMVTRKAKAKSVKSKKAEEKKSEQSVEDVSQKPDEVKLTEVTKTIPFKRTGGPLNLTDPEFKKAKTDYSVAKDPKASKVFKSLFTSHESAAKQQRAHWVTYNPFYN